MVDDGGVRRGWRAFEPALRDQLQRATALHVRLTDIEISPAGASVVVVARLARARTDATTTSTEDGGVTLVLRKPDPASAWIIVSEHTSYRRS